jgi:Uma2 family endonuclease
MAFMEARDGADGIATSKAKLTYADFLLFPDDGQRHELIDGEHYVTPSPNIRHQQLSIRLSTELANYLRLHPIGEVFYAPLDCVMSDFDVVEPDLLVVLADQSNILTPQNVRGAPALVVEILSPGTRKVDERIKRDLYERAGVREYWVVDPLANKIRVHRREASGELRMGTVVKADSDDVLRTELLPEFQLPLGDYFR